MNPSWANGNFKPKCKTHPAAMAAGCGCFGGDGSEGPPEPTEEEFTGATAEATRALEDVIVVGAVHADSP